MTLMKEEAALEAVLFASGEAVEISKLAIAIEQDIRTTRLVMNHLMDKYNVKNRGIHIIRTDESYQMCTNPDYYSNVEQLVVIPQKRALSQTLLETLAIIAYKQPITKNQIEEIRGVNADHAVNKLVEYSLVIEKGRQETPGRPLLFGTSDEFLRYFGFASLQKLPMLDNDFDRLKEEATFEVNALI